jgi:hypothetical protein
MTSTEQLRVIEQDQEIVRFNERLRQLRAPSPEQRIKHLAARAQELRVANTNDCTHMPQQEDEWGSGDLRAVKSLKLEDGESKRGVESFKTENREMINDEYSCICSIIQSLRKDYIRSKSHEKQSR